MIEAEYREWFHVFQVHHSSVVAWLNKQKPELHDSVSDLWFDLFRDIALQDALDASRAMYDGTIDRPRSFEHVVRDIAKHAKHLAFLRRTKRRAQYIDGELTVQCLDCRDTGLVNVWSPKVRKRCEEALRSGREFDGTRYREAGMPCHCDTGARSRGWMNSRGYDAQRDLRYDRKQTHKENVDSLVASVEQSLQGVEWEPN